MDSIGFFFSLHNRNNHFFQSKIEYIEMCYFERSETVNFNLNLHLYFDMQAETEDCVYCPEDSHLLFISIF